IQPSRIPHVGSRASDFNRAFDNNQSVGLFGWGCCVSLRCQARQQKEKEEQTAEPSPPVAQQKQRLHGSRCLGHGPVFRENLYLSKRNFAICPRLGVPEKTDSS